MTKEVSRWEDELVYTLWRISLLYSRIEAGFRIDKSHVLQKQHRTDCSVTYEVGDESDNCEEESSSVEEDTVGNEVSNRDNVVENPKDVPWKVGYHDCNSFEHDSEDEHDTLGGAEHAAKRHGRKLKKPERYSYLTFVTAEDMFPNRDYDEPRRAEEAVNSERKEKPISSLIDDVRSLPKKEVFSVVEKPKDRKMIKCRWVFVLK